jgi:hypothetical protein
MQSEEKLSDEEIRQMFRLLRRYASTDMDQWDLFKFDSKRGKVFVSIALNCPPGQEEGFTEISHLLRSES